VDTDEDGVDDQKEVFLETNPFNPDTDGDGISDFLDPNPFTPKSVEPSPSQMEIARDILLGALFGEAGLKGNSLNWLVGDYASSSYYLIGWIVFSVVPAVGIVADVRDACQAIVNGEEIDAALNLAGVLSGAGDGIKIGNTVKKFVTKYPEKFFEVGKIIARHILKWVPDNAKINILDLLYDTSASTFKADDVASFLTSNGISVDKLVEFVGKGYDLSKLKKAIEMGVAKASEALLDKFGRYEKYSMELFGVSSLDNAAGVHKLARVFDAKGVMTVLVKEENGKIVGRSDPIKDFAVLKEGEHYGPHSGWGWRHIWEEHKEQFRALYEKQLGRKISDEELKKLILRDIENTLRNGKKIGEDAKTIKVEFEGIVVKISRKYPGSVQTAHPFGV
jgi:hypothetical protein